MKNKDYQIQIKINFEAMDDLEARKIAQEKIKELNFLVAKNAEVKLQRLSKNSPPIGIKLS